MVFRPTRPEHKEKPTGFPAGTEQDPEFDEVHPD